MCSREEVRQEVQASEHRMEQRVQQSHVALAKTISNLMGDENKDRKETKEMMAKILEQTTKTNGRVNALETWREVHNVETINVVAKLDNVCNALQRLNWLLIATVFGAVLKLVVL